ncbi:NmrA family NAD(P)-binding protein [Streptoalloteichus hindustanus]|uniref:Uncharacterized conserved protein YbjT, contains NAD(P)-binding and DUF2867 domains n=1 Tax=Streptoalloteichus hindustanus TaxID=2017 RepID=A0A1M5I6R8_STRHI|nr:NAD(P)H-binding protein [Streptoalloteichus hindustanus]SHG23975.1 Uncharacterized conserved protein YbjT, contains NAD(P)-binding and DUF2867 domains [Streptoalloteichus hindustanus]
MILVVGATAHFGRQTVEALLESGQKVRALTRDPEKATLPAGVEVVGGDLTRPETLAPALEGVTTVFLVLPYGLDATAFLSAARGRRIVFLSSGAIVDGRDTQPDVIAEYHHRVERAITEAASEWTFLRLFFPAINALSFAMQLNGSDVIRAPYAEFTSAPVHERDVAEVAARVLTEDGHAGRVYDLTGPESMTQREQVQVLGEALGRPLRFEELDPKPVLEQMRQFMDGDFITALFDLMGATVGKPAEVSPVVERITGHPARSFAQWAADHRADFS